MEEIFTNLGEKSFHGKQLYKWLYNTRQYDFHQMTDLTKKLRDRLASDFEVKSLELEERVKSTDGTEKLLFRLNDGHPIETVLIPDEDRCTVCLSSQSGCALGCKFCATGNMGLMRNLTVGEIIGQLMFLLDRDGENSFSNIVFMGMGEPFNNYDNMVEALKILSDHLGLAIAARKTTVSTVGITPMIYKYADSGLKAHLAVSLHAASQEKREQIIPNARTYDLVKLMEAVRYYTGKTGRRVFFEYILFKDFNDTKADALALAKLVEGIPCKINLLACNPVPGLGFDRPDEARVDLFAKTLYPRTPAVTVRRSRGQDIAAACGQLAAKTHR